MNHTKIVIAADSRRGRAGGLARVVGLGAIAWTPARRNATCDTGATDTQTDLPATTAGEVTQPQT